MVSKCPPGVICIENMTLLLAIGILLIVMFVVKYWSLPFLQSKKTSLYVSSAPPSSSPSPRSNQRMPSTNLMPISGRYQGIKNQGVPINVPTQPGNYDAPYKQVGILKGGGEILPLMGKQLITGRDTWNFYTVSNQRTQVRLPISHKGKSCTSEYGCDNLYNGDSVYVEGYDEAFMVTMYENQTLRYIPKI